MRRHVLLGLLCCALLLPVPARSVTAPSPPLDRITGALSRGRVVYTDYADRGLTEIFDATGRLVRRMVSGGYASHDASAADDPGAQAPSQSQRCSNWGTHDSNEPGVPRPWRMSEDFHINSSGAPSHRVSDWYNQLWEGKRVWEQTRNGCGVGDTIIWDMPNGGDTGTPINQNCGETNDENVIGWADMGGWGGEGLILARTCAWWDQEFIYEADLIFNNNDDAKWANGAYANYWDLQSVAAHEFGHALGLGHVEPNGTRETATAVMHAVVFTGDTRNRSLSRGDIEGAAGLYPRLYGFNLVASKIINPAGQGQRLEPARTYWAEVELENTGYRTWLVGDLYGVMIATYPLGRCSAFAGPDWRTCSIPSLLDEATDDGGGGPENGANIVAQGETGRFRFQIPIRWGDEGRASFENFRVIGLPVSDPGLMTLPVDIGTYKMSVTDTSGPGMLLSEMLVRGIPGSASVTVRNDGTAPWTIGDGRMQLVTDPPGRCSRNGTSDWANCWVASWIDAPEAVVLPGQTATFRFGINSRFHTDTASYWDTERFDVAIIGRSPERMGAQTTFRFQVL